MAHLLERWGDQAREPDHVRTDLPRGREDLRRGDHHAQVQDVVVVAAQDDANDVLADVVDVALDRGHDDPALRLGRAAARPLLGLDERDEVGDRRLHHPGALDDLGEEHLAGAEKVADAVHPGHQRPLDHVERARSTQARLLHVRDDVLGNPLHERVREPLPDGERPPGQVRAAPVRAAARRVRDREEPLGRVGAPVQDQVLDAFAELGLDLRVDRERCRVHDPHPHPGPDGVVQEDRVDGLADGVVAAEREGDVADAAAHDGMGEPPPQLPGRVHVGRAVARVLLDPGPDREDVRVVDHVLVVETRLFHEQPVRAGENLDLALRAVGLACLVEGHDDDGGAIPAGQPRLGQEGRLALLEGERVDDRLALHGPEPGLDHRPPRRVDHHGDAGDRRLPGDEVQEAGHRRLRVEHRLVHVHVDDLGAVLHLVACDRNARLVVAGEDPLRKRA